MSGVREICEAELAPMPDPVRSQIGIDDLGAADLTALQDDIARRHGATWAEVKSASRSQHLCAARRSLYAALRKLGWSYPAIGRLVDRDHTTVLKALERHDR